MANFTVLLLVPLAVRSAKSAPPSWDCSKAEKNNVKEAWTSLVSRRNEERKQPFVNAVFKRFFELEPATKSMFDAAAKLDAYGRPNHGPVLIRILHSLDLTMDFAFNFGSDSLDYQLKHTGTTHAKMDRMQPHYFKALMRAFAEVLEQTLYEFDWEAWHNCTQGWAQRSELAFHNEREKIRNRKQAT